MERDTFPVGEKRAVDDLSSVLDGSASWDYEEGEGVSFDPNWDEEWKAECLKYEELLSRNRPRRNYWNALGVVEDKEIFPYDDRLYLLLDAYDTLYPEGRAGQDLDEHSILPNHLNTRGNDAVDGFLPCSIQSICETLLENPAPLRDGLSELDVLEESMRRFATLPSESLPALGPSLLLRLLRHSLSDLQRDFLLASAVVARMVHERSFDDVGVLHRYLCILSTHTVDCLGPCVLQRDHICSELKTFCELQGLVFSYGISTFTREHAVTISGLVHAIFHHHFGNMVMDAIGSEIAGTVATQRRREVLRREFVQTRLEIEDESNPGASLFAKFPFALAYLFSGIGRSRRDESLESQWNAIRSLASIATICLKLLPASLRFQVVSSHVVAALHQALRGDATILLSDPFRLAKAVQNRRRYRTELSVIERAGDGTLSVDDAKLYLREGRPPQYILDVVRGLYVSDMVCLHLAKVGYVDFLVQCRYEVHPLDYALLWTFCAVPTAPLDDTGNHEDPSDEAAGWSTDEVCRRVCGLRSIPIRSPKVFGSDPWHSQLSQDGKDLSVVELRAYHMCSVLALREVWYSPWCPDLHHTYQPAFQEAAKTVAMCFYRCNLPQVLVERVLSYLPRDGWSDPRELECAHYDCLLSRIEGRFGRYGSQRIEPVVPGRRVPCECRVAVFCSKLCRTNAFKLDGHKQACGVPPHRIPTFEDVEFLEKLRSFSPHEAMATPLEEVDVLEEDDGDDDWESIGSDEDEVLTRTVLITRYFRLLETSRRSSF